MKNDPTIWTKIPDAMKSNYLILKTSGDSNCYFNAMSILFYGNEEKSNYFRLLVAIAAQLLPEIGDKKFFLQWGTECGTKNSKDFIKSTLTPKRTEGYANAITSFYFSIIAKRPINIFRPLPEPKAGTPTEDVIIVQPFVENESLTHETYNRLKLALAKNSFSSQGFCGVSSRNEVPLSLFHLDKHFSAMVFVGEGEPIILPNKFEDALVKPTPFVKQVFKEPSKKKKRKN